MNAQDQATDSRLRSRKFLGARTRAACVRAFPALALALIAALGGWVTDAGAQQRTGTIGGAGGRTGGFGGGGAGFGGTAGSSRTYYSPGAVGEAMISSDPETRRLIVITDDETSEYISQVVTNLDRPKPQVLIKVVFLEITHNNASDIGVEGGFSKEINSSASARGANAFGLSGLAGSATGGVVNAFGLNAANFLPVPPGAGVYQVLGQDYQVTLRAIAQAGNAEVLSRPSILARHNQPATITVGQSVPLITDVRFDTFGNAINSVTYTDVGIILRVTPLITQDGLVEMIVSPELSSVSDTDQVPISNGVQAPVIDKRAADTVVVTPDGQTVIIGGLMGRSKSKAESKIPVLGDIPLLGRLFKREIKSDVKTELVIFLTPHIVQAPTQLSALSEQERDKALLTPKAFSESELDKFFDRLPVKGQSEPESDKKKK